MNRGTVAVGGLYVARKTSDHPLPTVLLLVDKPRTGPLSFVATDLASIFERDGEITEEAVRQRLHETGEGRFSITGTAGDLCERRFDAAVETERARSAAEEAREKKTARVRAFFALVQLSDDGFRPPQMAVDAAHTRGGKVRLVVDVKPSMILDDNLDPIPWEVLAETPVEDLLEEHVGEHRVRDGIYFAVVTGLIASGSAWNLYRSARDEGFRAVEVPPEGRLRDWLREHFPEGARGVIVGPSHEEATEIAKAMQQKERLTLLRNTLAAVKKGVPVAHGALVEPALAVAGDIAEGRLDLRYATDFGDIAEVRAFYAKLLGEDCATVHALDQLSAAWEKSNA